MRWDLDAIAGFCDGAATGTAVVTSVVVDSRTASDGALFVALPGEHADGHDFIGDAFARGAVAVVCRSGRLPDGVAGVEVADPLDALRVLAQARRAEIAAPVVAITGSSGKTTTKDFLATVLGAGTHAAPRSFNNEIGVPLTILACPEDATAVVVEVGSRGSGDITLLADAIQPDVAVITNIGRAHLETFGSVDGVLEAKWELVEALGTGGVAVLPADDRRVAARDVDRAVTFGESSAADIVATAISLDERGIASFDLRYGAEVVGVTMSVPGRHQAANAAAAIAVAVALGRPFAASAARLEHASVSQWRMESITVPVAGGSITVVNDAYNANPDSVTAALDTVATMPGRHLAVLGKMHELGTSEAAAHREMGALAASLGFVVVVVGDDPGIADGAGSSAVSVATPAAAIEHLRGEVLDGDVVLVKASRAAGLEAVALGLQEVHA